MLGKWELTSGVFQTTILSIGLSSWVGRKLVWHQLYSSTKMIPFQALYGRDPPIFFKGDTLPSKVEDANQLTRKRDLMLDRLKQNLTKAQHWSNRLTRNEEKLSLMLVIRFILRFSLGGLKSLAQKRNDKLSPRFYLKLSSITDKNSPSTWYIPNICVYYRPLIYNLWHKFSSNLDVSIEHGFYCLLHFPHKFW